MRLASSLAALALALALPSRADVGPKDVGANPPPLSRIERLKRLSIDGDETFRRSEFARAWEDAERVLAGYARAEGLKAPVFPADLRLEVFATQQRMWERYLELSGRDGPPTPPRPTTVALVAGSTVLAVTPEAYAQACPELAGLRSDSWMRLVAHELAHLWQHELALDRAPRWFLEGFAAIAAGQGFEALAPDVSVAGALKPVASDARDAYPRHAKAVTLLLGRTSAKELVARATQPGFDAWARAQPGAAAPR